MLQFKSNAPGEEAFALYIFIFLELYWDEKKSTDDFCKMVIANMFYGIGAAHCEHFPLQPGIATI